MANKSYLRLSRLKDVPVKHTGSVCDDLGGFSTRGWREPGNSIKDPGITRTGMGFLVMLLYEAT